MKLQIDTKAKTIKIDETVKFEDLIKVLNKLLPKEWKYYSLETNSIINWYNPIPWHSPMYIEPLYIEPYRVTCENNLSVYNVECQIN